MVGAIGVLHAVQQRSTDGGSYNVDLSLNSFNLWYLNLGLQDAANSALLLARNPNFHPRHHTDTFTLFDDTRKSAFDATGDKPGELFDPAHYCTGEIRWGKEGEVARYLDWTKIVTFGSGTSQAKGSSTQLGYDRGSCITGSDKPEW